MAQTAYYIPNGPENLQSIFPALPWAEIEEYYLEVYTPASAALIATTKTMIVDSCEDDYRIHFLNYAGAIDSVSVKLFSKEHESKSSEYEKPARVPLLKSAHTLMRNNVRANDTYFAVKGTTEEEVEYYDELLDSPLAWIEWPGTQDQPTDYIPIIMLDKKSIKRKEDDRFYYEINIEFKLSNDRIIIRN